MATLLGTVSLSDHLVLSGLEQAPDLAYQQRRTIGGRSVVHTAPVAGGRVLTLSGERHFTLAEIEAVKAMPAGVPVTLVHHRGTFQVVIVATAVEPDDASLHANPTAAEYYSGDITLIEV
jgi:hypothetical protein